MLMLPNFLILGAAKAGTTALYDLLIQHPQIYLSFVKEPMFFSRDDYYARGLDWYSDTFFKEGVNFKTRGEATPHYLYWAEKVAPRLAHSFGQDAVKFIVIFREPAQRAYSWYWNMTREEKENLPFVEALEAEPRHIQEQWDELYSFGSMNYGYFRGGCYATQLEYYLEQFPRDRFLFLLQEDLKRDLAPTMHRLFNFLGADPDFVVQPVVSNPAAMPRSRGVQYVLHEPSFLKELFKLITPFSFRYRLKHKLSDANLKSFDYPPLDPQIAAWLRGRYVDEVRRLSTLIGRDLSHWLVGK